MTFDLDLVSEYIVDNYEGQDFCSELYENSKKIVVEIVESGFLDNHIKHCMNIVFYSPDRIEGWGFSMNVSDSGFEKSKFIKFR